MAERSGWVALQAGMHAFEVVFFQGCCGVGLRLEVNAPGQGRRAVPPGWMGRGQGLGVRGQGHPSPITHHPSLITHHTVTYRHQLNRTPTRVPNDPAAT
jgi:hypothetical protein